jgi:glucose/arabinose dehydrogenase
VATGLDTPVWVTAPSGDTERLFILEQPGVVRILKNGELLARPFLDISSEVNFGGAEQGLLGLAFHPQFESNGLFYVNYVTGTGAGVSVVRRFQVSGDPDSADAASGLSILQVPQPFDYHNGAHLAFGPDGYLYFGLGDGGGNGDPVNRAQNPQSLLGKLLRIDVDGDDFPADTLRNYAVPPTNPFAGNPDARDEIWALGLRNPYRFAFDPVTHDLYIGDVGNFCYEEIDYQPAASTGGENYGWRVMEGAHCFDRDDPFNCDSPIPCDGSALTFPVHEVLHTPNPGACWAVIPGPVYRGSAIPAIQGRFFFGDYCNSRLWSLRVEGGVAVDLVDHTGALGPGIDYPSAIGCDGVGEMYIADWCCGFGEVYKIIPDTHVVGAPPPGVPSASFHLSRPSPNPFRDAARIELRLHGAADMRVSVHDAAGRLVRRLLDGRQERGVVSLEWDGRDHLEKDVAAGVYFIRAASPEGAAATRSVTLVR